MTTHDADGRRNIGWLGRTRPWAIWSIGLAPVTPLLHELAHMLVAYAVGYPSPTLHFSSVDPGPSDGLPPSAAGLVALAGPVRSALLALVGCALLWRQGPAPWSTAPTVSAVSRFVVAVPYTIDLVAVQVMGLQLAPPAFDEYKAGTALHISGNALLASTSLLLCAVRWWVHRQLYRHLPPDEARGAWVGLVVGTAAGWAGWMLGLGPLLVP